MSYFRQLIKLIIILSIALSFSGCASMSWFHKKDGDYDFFLQNKDGEKPTKVEDLSDEKIKSMKEAKLKAKAAVQEGDTDTALFYYVKVLEYDENDEESLVSIANIHDSRGNNDLAILAYRMVLAKNPESLDAKQGLGLCLIRANKYEEARDILLGALKDNPQRVKIYNGLGVISDLQRYYEEAQWFYAHALMIEKNSPVVLTNLGYSYFLSGQWDNAENLYKKVLLTQPKHAQAALNLALLQARRGQLFDAMASFERILPKPQAYNELGYILMLDKKYTMAEQLFQQAISSSPIYFDKAYKNLDKLKELQAQNEIVQTAVNQ